MPFNLFEWLSGAKDLPSVRVRCRLTVGPFCFDSGVFRLAGGADQCLRLLYLVKSPTLGNSSTTSKDVSRIIIACLVYS
jgi:hypothetical protein